VRGHNADLAWTAGLAIVSALLVTLGSGLGAARTPFVVPLLLFLPGYALSSALFVAPRLDAARQVLLSVGLSISAAVVCALVLNVTPAGLSSASWAVVLVSLTCAACFAADLRRAPVDPEAAPPILPRLRRRDALLLVVASAVVGGAIGLARTPLPAANVRGYTALWLLPATHPPATIRVGIVNDELRPMRYRLVVRVGGRVEHTLTAIQLRPGEQMQRSIPLDLVSAAAPARVEALLYRAGSPNTVYRRTTLSLIPTPTSATQP
jgi:uncharacterized membrane protein